MRIAGLGGAAALLRAQDAPEPFFPFGAIHMSTISHWQHYLPPVEEWAAYMDRELRNMREVRFNTLVAHVDWYDIETAPGRFEFERLDRLMDLVGKHGMKILVWPWPEMQPDWMIDEYPDAEWLASDGYRPGSCCWDHPQVRALSARFIERVVTRYRDRPCILGWDVGAEAGIWVAGIGNAIDENRGSRLYCYCKHTTARYREWLERKYGTIEKLNEVWASHYGGFASVKPVRTGVFERAQIFWTDWREFMLANTTDFQRLKAETVKRLDARHPATAHTGGWGGGYVHHAGDEYNIAKHFDVMSLSFFPYWLEYGYGSYHPALGGLMLDGTRSAAAGKPVWIEELQGGPSVRGLAYRSRMPRPQDIRLWTWQSVAHGAKGIFYWNWRPETTGIEASGFGLVNYDGTLTDRAREAGEISRVLQKHARLFAEARPPAAEIAALHNPRTSILAAGEGNETVCLMSLAGLYRALWKKNLPVDLLVPEQLLSEDLSRYKAIYLPFAYTLSRAEGARLRAYVENGGALYGELWCGLKDDRTFLYETVPGAGLAEVFHVKELAVNPAGKGKYQEQLALLAGAEVLARFDDGSPSLVAGRFGKGRTLYAATMLTRNYADTDDEASSGLLTRFAAEAGVKAPVEVKCAPAGALVEARVLETPGGGRVLFFLNHGETPAMVAARLPGAFTDLVTGEKLRPEFQLPGGGVVVASNLTR